MVYTRWGLSGDSRTSCGIQDSQPHETQGLDNRDLTLSLNEVYRRKLEHLEYHIKIKIMAGKVAQWGACGQASWPEYPRGQLRKAVLWQAPQNKWVSQVQWLTPLVPALRRRRQEDLCELELSLGYKLNKQTNSTKQNYNGPSLITCCFNLYGFNFILRTHLSSSL